MIKIAMVGVGGAMGAISRYMVYEVFLTVAKNAWLPLGTIFVNIAGCLIIGFLGGLAETRGVLSPELRALIFIGFLGGFTTFSTFGFELFAFIRNGQMGIAVLNATIQITLGLLGVWLGFSLSRWI